MSNTPGPRAPRKQQSYAEFKMERERASSKLQSVVRGMIMRRRRREGGFAAVVEAAMAAEVERKIRAEAGRAQNHVAPDYGYTSGQPVKTEPPQRRSWWRRGNRNEGKQAQPPKPPHPPQAERTKTKAEIKKEARDRAVAAKKAAALLAKQQPPPPATPLEKSVRRAEDAAAAAEAAVSAVFAAVEAGDSALAAERAVVATVRKGVS